jgi:hypothetical protein
MTSPPAARHAERVEEAVLQEGPHLLAAHLREVAMGRRVIQPPLRLFHQ